MQRVFDVVKERRGENPNSLISFDFTEVTKERLRPFPLLFGKPGPEAQMVSPNSEQRSDAGGQHQVEDCMKNLNQAGRFGDLRTDGSIERGIDERVGETQQHTP